MVDSDLAARKISRARGWLADAGARFDRGEALLEDRSERDLATFYLFLAIQEALDLAAHWVSDEGWGTPDDFASTFDVLADRGAIGRELADGMRAAAGLRNRIGHGCAMVDHRRLLTEMHDGAAHLRAFLAAAATAAGL